MSLDKHGRCLFQRSTLVPSSTHSRYAAQDAAYGVHWYGHQGRLHEEDRDGDRDTDDNPPRTGKVSSELVLELLVLMGTAVHLSDAGEEQEVPHS